MATIFNRGFVQRSLPALLALFLGLLVAPQPASSALPGARHSTAAAFHATTRTPAAEKVHSGQSVDIADAAAPLDHVAEAPEHNGPQPLRAQVTAGPLGSRAPPAALANQ
jgi:hypothetical protein